MAIEQGAATVANRIADTRMDIGPSAPLGRAHPGWTGLPITLERLPAREEVSGVVMPEAAFSLIRSGSGKRRYSADRQTGEIPSTPGMIDFCARGLCFDHASWDGNEGEVILIQLPACMVNRLLQGDAQPLELQTRFAQFDAPLAQVTDALWNEAAAGSPNGSLYVQGMTVALIGLLHARYAVPSSGPARRVGKFGARDTDRLRAFIEEHLCSDLRIERLAASVGMSPWYFAKMFKATFGESPHAFVLERRIEAACRLLRREPDRPVVDIANEFGFSSQAHFTDAFRRRVGTTPARWRRAA
jgi:AraC family transcriptional regulator